MALNVRGEYTNFSPGLLQTVAFRCTRRPWEVADFAGDSQCIFIAVDNGHDTFITMIAERSLLTLFIYALFCAITMIAERSLLALFNYALFCAKLLGAVNCDLILPTLQCKCEYAEGVQVLYRLLSEHKRSNGITIPGFFPLKCLILFIVQDLDIGGKSSGPHSTPPRWSYSL